MNKKSVTISVYDPSNDEVIHTMISNRDAVFITALSVIGVMTICSYVEKGTGYMFRKVKDHLSNKQKDQA